MGTKTNPDGDGGLRCPSCNGRDVVASLPRHFWDEIMRGWGRLPKQCRTCGRRFYVREPRRTASEPRA
ncbi:MAG TPA: hypothetical protein VKX45_09065 [Bryobacteraceae bacterium]|nr:hypothetical protein [Bryobacteraceae bacterium]